MVTHEPAIFLHDSSLGIVHGGGGDWLDAAIIGHIELGSGDTPPVKCACKPFVLGLEDGGLAR